MPTNTAPAALILTTFAAYFRAMVAALRVLSRDEFIPDVGLVTPAEFRAAARAAAPAYHAGDRDGAVLAMARTLYAGFDAMRATTREELLLPEAGRVLAYLESFAR